MAIITTNGFFGNIQGPFEANTQILQLIQEQCKNTVNYISKLGIHYIGNYDLDLEGQLDGRQILVEIIDQIPGADDGEQSQFITTDFQIGKTRMLELEDVRITSIKFKQNMDDSIYLDYQYK